MAAAVVSDCRNRPITSETEARRIAWEREALIKQVTSEDAVRVGRNTGVWPASPIAAYTVLFGEYLDPYLINLVQQLYERAARMPLERRREGHIYVFHDRRDAQDVVKIGATSQPSVERRIGQWREQLRAAEHDIVMLWSLPCADAILAEAVLHTLFWCQQASARINRLTNRRLVEYFIISDRIALRFLCRVVCRHVNVVIAGAGASCPRTPWSGDDRAQGGM